MAIWTKTRQNENPVINFIKKSFLEVYQNYADTLNKEFAKDKLPFGKAGRLETSMYLLFRIDLELHINKQQKTVNNRVMECCEGSAPNFGVEHYHSLLDHRFTAYGQIFNEEKGPDANWLDIIKRWNFWFLNAILFSKGKLKNMVAEEMPLVLVGLSRTPLFVHFLIILESNYFCLLACCLKHLCSDTDDCTTLSKDELEKRIKLGCEEAARKANEK